MDLPPFEDRPVTDPGMEIPFAHQPGQYSYHGIYRINGLAFLENYEQHFRILCRYLPYGEITPYGDEGYRKILLQPRGDRNPAVPGKPEDPENVRPVQG